MAANDSTEHRYTVVPVVALTVVSLLCLPIAPALCVALAGANILTQVHLISTRGLRPYRIVLILVNWATASVAMIWVLAP
jgi:hypothetical protein